VPGASVSLVEEGRVVWTRGFGVTNAVTGQPVSEHTVFEAASLGKPLVAYTTLLLADSGRLDLDTPLLRLLSPAESAALAAPERDPRLQTVTARHVLTHTSGLPNEPPRGGALRTAFPPGERFSYSGEGFRLLQRALEHLTGERLDTLVRRLVFVPLGMTQSSFVWLPSYDTLKASGHDLGGDTTGRRRITTPNAAASLETTAADYGRFLAAVVGHGAADSHVTVSPALRESTRRAMQQPALHVDERCVVCLDRVGQAALPAPALGWGLGWGLARIDAGAVSASAGGERWLMWHWGDNGDFQAFAVGDPAIGRALVVFTNSPNGLSIMPELVETALGPSFGTDHVAWTWAGYERYGSPERTLARATLARGPAALREWQAAHPADANGGQARAGLPEGRLVQLGTALLGKDRPRDAIGVLEIAVQAYPRSAPAQAALGDAYRRVGDRARAVASYRASLALDSTSGRVASVLRRLEHPVAVRPSLLEAYTGRYQAPFGVIVVAREGDQLLVRVAGEPTTELVATNERRFAVGDEGGPEITFVTDTTRHVSHALLHLRGQELRAPRID
jgi:CubicO group peptidase (beta-lactamase class C family)